MNKTVLLPLATEGSAQQRLARSGLTTMTLPAGIQIAAVNLHSPADRAGFEQGFVVTGIETEVQRPAKEWLFVRHSSCWARSFCCSGGASRRA